MSVTGELAIGGEASRRPGTVRAGRRGLWYRQRGQWPHAVEWGSITTWSIGRDTSSGAPRHTHALRVAWVSGELVLRVRGPLGALALVRLRDEIRPHMHRLLA